MLEIDGKYYKVYEMEEIDKEKYIGFIYVTINKINGKKYVGQHTKWKDTYLGSGKWLNHSIDKYGRQYFERFIIDLAVSQEELNSKEAYYITCGFGVNTIQDISWYNISDHVSGGSSLSGYTKEQMDEYRRKCSVRYSGEKNPMYGRKHSDETRRIQSEIASTRLSDERERTKISLATKKAMESEDIRQKMRDNHIDVSGENNPMYGNGYKLEGDKNGMYGKTHTQEVCKLLSEIRSMPIIVKLKAEEFERNFSSQLEFSKFIGVSDVQVGRWIKDCSKNRSGVEYIRRKQI